MKRYTFSYYISLILGCILLVVVLWIAYPNFQEKVVINPLPSFLSVENNKEVSTLNIWAPKNGKVMGSNINKPEISAKAAFVYDLSKDVVLYEKNSRSRLPIASLTKIMTAVIALENKKNNDKYAVAKDALVGENSMGLTDGESLTLEELLYGLILPSGNDAAETLAENYPAGRQAFISAMNAKARTLGLSNTNFTNPSGLEGDGNQYSTTYDLLVITKYALSNFPLFNKVVSTYYYEIPYTEDHKAFYLYNDTNLLTTYPGVKGVKTGFTDEANLCLVTYLDYDGHKIIGVILGSNNRREEMKELLDYSLKSIGVTPPPHS